MILYIQHGYVVAAEQNVPSKTHKTTRFLTIEALLQASTRLHKNGKKWENNHNSFKSSPIKTRSSSFEAQKAIEACRSQESNQGLALGRR